MNSKITWIGKTANLKKLQELGIIDKKKDQEIKLIQDQVKKIQDEKTQLEELSKQKAKNLVEKKNQISKVDNRITHLDTVLRPRYNAFVTGYNLATNLKTWTERANSTDPKKTNVYPIKHVSTGVLETTEDEMARLVAAVAKQLESIDDADFDTKITAHNPTNAARAITLLATIKTNTGKMTKINTRGDQRTQKWDFQHEFNLEFPTDVNGNPDYSQTPTKITTQIFPFEDFFEFLILVAPQHDKKVIREVKNSANTSKWTITPKGVKFDPDKAAEYGYSKDGEWYLGGKIEEAKEIPCNNLEDWVDLFWAAFEEVDNRKRFLDSVLGNPRSTTPSSTNNPILKLVMDLTDTTANDVKEGADELGTTYYNYDVDKELEEIKVTKLELEGEKEYLEKDMGENAKKIGEKESEIINKETEKLLPKEEEVQKLVEEQIKEQQKKVDDAKITETTFDWTVDTNKVKGAYIKWLLKNIKYLENGGNDTQPFKESKNTTALTLIESKLTDQTALNALIKSDFESKGTDLESRITKIESEGKNGGYGLRFYRDFYESLGDSGKTELHALNKKLGLEDEKKEDPKDDLKTYQDKLKAVDPLLTDQIITQAVIEDFKQYENFKSSQSLETFFKKVLKEGKLIESFKKVMEKSDSEITDLGKLVQKKKAKEIITLVSRWEYDQREDKDPEKSLESKTQWTRRILKLYGKDANHTLTEEELNTALFEIATSKKTLSGKALDKNLKEQESEEPEKPQEGSWKDWLVFRKDNWGKPLLTYFGMLAVVLGVLTAVFWKWISSWWNGPALEGEESDDE